MANHTILGGKVHIYKRPNSRFWQCCTWLAGRNRRTTTKQESLQLAKEFAEDWYLIGHADVNVYHLPADAEWPGKADDTSLH